MKGRLLLQKAIESNVKPQPVKPQHKEVKPRTFVCLLIVQQGAAMKRQTGPSTQVCFLQNTWCCKAYKLVSFVELVVSSNWIWKLKNCRGLTLWQYGLSSFQAGGIKLERFLPKNQQFLNFENWTNGEVSKSAKIWLSKSIFYVKHHPNLSKKKFIEEYQFRRTFFVKSIFGWLQF